MTKLLIAAILFAASPAFAAGETKVIDHHVAAMKAGDLNAVLSDYAPDAVVVAPPDLAGNKGVFAGADTKKLFSVLTDKTHVPGNRTMTTRYEAAGPDTTIMRWVQFGGTAQEVSGYDVFVIRGGKIAYQAVIVNPAPRLMKAN